MKQSRSHLSSHNLPTVPHPFRVDLAMSAFHPKQTLAGREFNACSCVCLRWPEVGRGDRGSVLPDLAPALFLHFYVELLRGALNPLPRRVALRVAHALHLIETRNGIAH